MAPDPFASSRQRIKRAKAHIRNLDKTFHAFIGRKPYKLVADPDLDGIHDVLKLKAKRRRLPASFSDLSNDAIENLRAALDHAAYAIALITPSCPREKLCDVYFPFGWSKANLAKGIRKKCPGFRKEILALLCALRPYKGGNDTLWALNAMAIESKHKSVTRMIFRIPAAHTYEISGVSNLSLPPTFDSDKNEFKLGVIKHGSRARYNAGFAFQIGFDNVPVLSGKPAIATLYEMAHLVDSIVAALEAESRRIGLVP